MSVLTIGRVGLVVDVDEVNRFSGSGQYGRGQIQLSGTIVAADLPTTLAVRDELVAQAETVQDIPVSWTEEPNIDGFYRIVGMSYELASLTANGFVTFSITLDRLGVVGSVGWQSQLAGALRPNSHSIVATDARPLWGVGGGYVIVEWPPYGPSNGEFRQFPTCKPHVGSLVGDFDYYGNVACHAYDDLRPMFSATGLLETPYPIVHYPHAPAEFYANAPELYTDGFPRAGKWIPNIPSAATATPLEWVLTNGILRVEGTVHDNAATGAEITTYVAGSGGWESSTTWEFWRLSTSDVVVPEWQAIEVVENTPWKTTIRLMSPIWTLQKMLFLDITLKRGVAWVLMNAYTHDLDSLTSGGIAIYAQETGSVAGITGGIERSTVDTDGNKWLLAASGEDYPDNTATLTFDTTLGGAEYVLAVGETGRTVDFGISYEIDSPQSDGTGRSPHDLLDTYYGPTAEAVRPILR